MDLLENNPAVSGFQLVESLLEAKFLGGWLPESVFDWQLPSKTDFARQAPGKGADPVHFEQGIACETVVKEERLLFKLLSKHLSIVSVFAGDEQR
jgi:hypothetical protein